MIIFPQKSVDAATTIVTQSVYVGKLQLQQATAYYLKMASPLEH
jgi:hypothetical protein